MSKSKWLDEVTQALRRRGLPRSYIRRFTDELAEHYQDLCQETVSMDANQFAARLGSAEQLASRAARELRLRTYAGRHPLWTFVAAPVPTAAALVVALCAAFVLVGSALPDDWIAGESMPAWGAPTLQATVWAMQYAPFLAGALLFCHLAKRAACGARWSLVACALVAILAGMFAVDLKLPTEGPGSGTLTMGLGIPPGPTQWLQALAPFAVWLVYTGRELRRGDPAVTS
jgi:hypothetical protein